MASTGYMDYLSHSMQEDPQKSTLGFDRNYQQELSSSEPMQAGSEVADVAQAGPWLNAASHASHAGGGKGPGGVMQGALAGAAAGSAIAPGVGTAVGAGLGAVAAVLSSQADAEENRKKNIMNVYQELGNDQQSALQGMGNMWSRIL